MNALELHGVSKEFGAGRAAVRALDDVSLEVAAGELIIIMGPSGSGKTTLLQIVGAMLTPTSGSVTVNGQALAGATRRELAELRLREIGFIFQSFNLFSALTARENIELPAVLNGTSRRVRRAAVDVLLERLDLTPRASHLPEQLSGGEKQRVSIARALINDPSVLLADEPTANLDSTSGYQVLHLLQDVARERGKTVVVVTHDHRITDAADRLLWLEDGRLRDRATTFQTAADPVCGMDLVIERAAAVRHIDGQTVYLCSQICAQRFDADPARYLIGAQGMATST